MQARRFSLTLLLVANLLLISCKTSRVMGTDSPDAAIKEYMRALASSPIGDAFWQHDEAYKRQLRQLQERVPQAMWNDQEKQLRAKWATEIDQGRRNSPYPGAELPCWQVIRPGGETSIIESRPGEEASGQNPEHSGPLQWKTFAKVTYSDEKLAFRSSTPKGAQPIREAILRLSISRDSTQSSVPLLVSDRCELIPEKLVFWPAPPLTNDKAAELIRSALPHTELVKSVMLRTQTGIMGQQLGSWENFTATAGSLQRFYNTHGFQVDGFKINPGFWYTDARVRPPSTWNQYDMGNSRYALNESTDTQIKAIRQQDLSALATVRFVYTGCTPACVLAKDLQAQSNLGQYVFADFVTHDWPKEETVEASYRWDADRGWIFAGLNRH